MNIGDDTALTRRDTLLRIALAPLTLSALMSRAQATPDMMREAIEEFTGKAAVKEGRVALDIPPLVENGNTVPLVVDVESPMNDKDHVKEIRIFNEKNPQPHIIGLHLSPRNGVAKVSTRVKLNDTQRVVAIARMSDGSFWSGGADVIVTIAACVETFEQ